MMLCQIARAALVACRKTLRRYGFKTCNFNKAAEFGIGFEDSETVGAPRVRDSALALECKLTGTVPVGDHTMYIAEVTAVFADREKRPVFAAEGYRKLRAFEVIE